MRPGLTLIGALLGLALLGALVVFDWLPMVAWYAGILLLLVVAGIDALALRNLKSPEVAREHVGVMALGVARQITLTLRSNAAHTMTLEVHDLAPAEWPSSRMPQRLELLPGRNQQLHYLLTPTCRGEFDFPGVHVRLLSPLRCWESRRQLVLGERVRVFPNFVPLTQLTLTGLELASRSLGAHLQRRRGSGTDFHQLRDYRAGDTLRQIDWKASQRVHRLISRDYTDERNQRVMLVLDRGRRMLTHDGQLSHFDHALNAALVLSYIALRQGDSVGILSPGDDARYLPPVSGPGGLDALLNAVFDLQPRMEVTDYPDAARMLLSRQPRRSLVVVLTNVRDEDIDDLLLATSELKRRHLVCVASLREALLTDIFATQKANFEDALTIAATAQYLTHRTLAHAKLRAAGVQVLDVSCSELAPTLIQHYLALKRAGAL